MPTVAQHYVARSSHAGGPAAAATTGSAAPVVLMVSGGADSTALLLMACTSELDLADGRGRSRIARERLHVLHVNHHLRGAASDGDEAFVRDLCERYGLPLCVEHASFEDLGGRNLEAAARDVRYAAARRYVRDLCRDLGAPRSQARIVTAHTASDRAETFFMNAIKGSGPAGLSSIPRRRNIIVRPLIDRTHEELVRYLEVAGQGWREDESNSDTSYLRNFVRHKLLPLARARNGNVERTVGAACDIMGDEDAFMSQLAATALRTCTRQSQDGLMVLDGARMASSEIAIARRMVRLAVRAVEPEARLEMRHVEAVLACVASGEGSVTLPGGVDARMEFGALSIRAASAREELAAGWLSVPGTRALANGCVLKAELVSVPAGADPVAWARDQALAAVATPGAGPAPVTEQGVARANPQVAFVDAIALGYDARDLATGRSTVRLWVGSPVPGDVMCPLGMGGRSRKLSDILGSARVPVAERAAVPVVRTAPGGAVVWVAGIRLDERFKCRGTSSVLVKLDNLAVMGEQGAM